MTRPIVNVEDAPIDADSNGEYFAFTMRELSAAAGARAIGANVTRVPPGKAAFPFHHHRANEEHFFVLSGVGVLRLGSETFDVKPQDYIVNLPGGPEHAHQLINTGSEDLVYLAISTQVRPEAVGYPDSQKTSVRLSMAQGPDARFIVDDAAKDQLGYFSREDGAAVAAILRGRER